MVTTHAVDVGLWASVKTRIAVITAILGRVPPPLLQLLFRLAVATVFLKAGLTKLAGWEFTVQLFADEYNVPVLPPEMAAVCATTCELSCSMLLMAGLLTRGPGPVSLDRLLGLEPARWHQP